MQAIGLLQDPMRRKLYDFVVAQDHLVSRSEAAAATGVTRTLVAFHLDKLVEGGLLSTSSQRLNGRSGPGAGRPAKLYRRSDRGHQVSLPPRDHATVAELLAEAAAVVRLDETLFDVARRHGEELARSTGPSPAETLDEASELLRQRGYEPWSDGDVVRLRNCPFQPLADAHPGMICGMNLALVDGLLGDAADVRARLDPRPGDGCCVVIESKNNER